MVDQKEVGSAHKTQNPLSSGWVFKSPSFPFIILRFLVGFGKYCVELVTSIVLSLNVFLESLGLIVPFHERL